MLRRPVESAQRYVIGVIGHDQRRAIRKEKLGGAAHAHELRARRQPDIPDAIVAGRDRQRLPRARGFIDGALQRLALIVVTARTQPKMGGVDAEAADRRGVSGPRRRAQGGGGANGKKAAAVEVQGRTPKNLMVQIWGHFACAGSG